MRLLFPLDSADRLGGEVEEDAVDSVHFVSDTVGNAMENFIGDLLDSSGHSVCGIDRADDCGPSLVTLAVLNTYTLEIGHGDKILPNLGCKTAVIELFAEDSVCFAEGVESVTGDCAQTAHTKTGAGKG